MLDGVPQFFELRVSEQSLAVIAGAPVLEHRCSPNVVVSDGPPNPVRLVTQVVGDDHVALPTKIAPNRLDARGAERVWALLLHEQEFGVREVKSDGRAD